jgi:hypothetical protein
LGRLQGREAGSHVQRSFRVIEIGRFHALQLEQVGASMI